MTAVSTSLAARTATATSEAGRPSDTVASTGFADVWAQVSATQPPLADRHQTPDRFTMVTSGSYPLDSSADAAHGEPADPGTADTIDSGHSEQTQDGTSTPDGTALALPHVPLPNVGEWTLSTSSHGTEQLAILSASTTAMSKGQATEPTGHALGLDGPQSSILVATGGARTESRLLAGLDGDAEPLSTPEAHSGPEAGLLVTAPTKLSDAAGDAAGDRLSGAHAASLTTGPSVAATATENTTVAGTGPAADNTPADTEGIWPHTDASTGAGAPTATTAVDDTEAASTPQNVPASTTGAPHIEVAADLGAGLGPQGPALDDPGSTGLPQGTATGSVESAPPSVAQLSAHGAGTTGSPLPSTPQGTQTVAPPPLLGAGASPEPGQHWQTAVAHSLARSRVRGEQLRVPVEIAGRIAWLGFSSADSSVTVHVPAALNDPASLRELHAALREAAGSGEVRLELDSGATSGQDSRNASQQSSFLIPTSDGTGSEVHRSTSDVRASAAGTGTPQAHSARDSSTADGTASRRVDVRV